MKRIFGFISIIVVMFFWSERVMCQTKTVYIRLDEAEVSTSKIVGQNSKRISADQLSGIRAVRSVQVLRSGDVTYKNARTQQEVSSKHLKGIYHLEVLESSVDFVLDSIQRYSNILAVDVAPDLEVLFIPNDELIADQTSLSLINAYGAWDITRGDAEILIGVSDTGFDLDHEDLINKVYHNESDPINGVDDDNNGYLDDYEGWDFADDDNNPTYAVGESNSHGSNVAGVIAAETNNGLGIAGLAYESEFVPLKVASSSGGEFVNAYESIIYAADIGCDVVNLSWGGIGYSPSSILQSIIDYAVLERDMVVVAAAGNTNADLDFYPASFDHVLSVGISDADDVKSSGATYSHNIDLIAPGILVMSTNINDTYGLNSGSSFSSPQVAATAALVKSMFPEYNAIQIMEHVRMTSDDVYGAGNNMDYYGKLGKGRLNMLRAVSETEVGAMRLYDEWVDSKFENLIFPEDTIELVLNFVNILRDLNQVQVVAESESDYLTIINPEILLGDLYSYDSVSDVRLQAVISSDAPTSESMSVRLNYGDDSGYDDFEYVVVETAGFYLTMNNGVVSNVVSSNGNLGYASDGYSDGTGLNYSGLATADVMGLMIGHSAGAISDNVFNAMSAGTRDGDFVAIDNVSLRDGGIADWHVRGTFSNAIDGGEASLLVEQELLLWESSDLNEIAVYEYYVSNTSDVALTDMKVGLYVDFDLGSFQDDYVVWDDTGQLGYSYDEEGGVYCGLALLTSQDVTFNAIDVKDKEGNSLDVTDMLEDMDKYDLLSVHKVVAGGMGGHDVAQLLVANIPSFGAYASEKIAFTLLFGTSLEDLNAKLVLAKAEYEMFLATPDLNWTRYVCEGASVELSNDNTISLYEDPLMQQLIVSGDQLVLDGIDKGSVLYYVEEMDGVKSDVYKLYLDVFNPEIDFRASPEVLYLGDIESNVVQFIDETLSATSWSWDFSNGFLSTNKNPYTFFEEEGSYSVYLDVVTELGCNARDTMLFEVIVRGDAPIIESIAICQDEGFIIEATNSDQLLFYNEATDGEPFFEGAQWEGVSDDEDVVYYVSSMASGVESLKIPVTVAVDPIEAQFSYAPDTLHLDAPELISISSKSQGITRWDWSLNGQVQANTSSIITYDVGSLDELEILLEVTSSSGCMVSSMETVAFDESAKPRINQNTVTKICKAGYVNSNPINGSTFVFYADESLTQIVSKGRSAILGPIVSDTSFYVVNISLYHMSEPIQLEISAIDFESEMVVTPDSLKYGQAPNVLFEAFSSDEVVSYQWYLEEELVETSPSVNLLFYDLEEYNTSLVTENSLGCYDTLNKIYKVYQVLDSEEALDARFNIYPNPVTSGGSVVVDSQVLMGEIKVYNALGQLICLEENIDDLRTFIQTDRLKSGTYVMVVLDVFGNAHYEKFVKH